MKKLTTKEFVVKANRIHDNLYGYNKVNYINSHTKVIIICKKHGTFEQRPNDHLNKHGCKKCQYDVMLKSSKEFIFKAKRIHNNYYNYDKSIYERSDRKLIIICPIHGPFLQIPNAHLQGKGCLYCSKSKQKKLKTKCNLEDKRNSFINKANILYGNRFSYDQVNFINSKKKVAIICKIHGLFYQSPSCHLKGIGCKGCISEEKLITYNEFIAKTQTVHGIKYIYNQENYKGWLCKMIIKCPIHDEFIQTPRDHVRGSGCPKCAHNRVSKSSQKWLDDLNVPLKYREKVIIINEKRLSVDGYDPNTNTIYEYFGYFWHGWPKIFNQDEVHPICKKTFGELYCKTLEKISIIEKSSYNFIYVWGK